MFKSILINNKKIRSIFFILDLLGLRRLNWYIGLSILNVLTFLKSVFFKKVSFRKNITLYIFIFLKKYILNRLNLYLGNIQEIFINILKIQFSLLIKDIHTHGFYKSVKKFTKNMYQDIFELNNIINSNLTISLYCLSLILINSSFNILILLGNIIFNFNVIIFL